MFAFPFALPAKRKSATNVWKGDENGIKSKALPEINLCSVLSLLEKTKQGCIVTQQNILSAKTGKVKKTKAL